MTLNDPKCISIISIISIIFHHFPSYTQPLSTADHLLRAILDRRDALRRSWGFEFLQVYILVNRV